MNNFIVKPARSDRCDLVHAPSNKIVVNLPTRAGAMAGESALADVDASSSRVTDARLGTWAGIARRAAEKIARLGEPDAT